MTRLRINKSVGWFTCVAACFGLLLWARLLLLTGHPRTAIADPSIAAPTPAPAAQPQTSPQPTPPRGAEQNARPAIPPSSAVAPSPRP